MTGAKIEEPKIWIWGGVVASIVRGSLKKVNFMQFLIADDVMAVYLDPGRWRQDGLQDLCEGIEEEIFLSIEDWHEPVQINLGPNVGDIITGRKLARKGRVIPMKSYYTWSPWRQRWWRFKKAQGPKVDYTSF